MKKIFLRVFFITQLILEPILISGVFADPPGPPGPGGDPSGGGTAVGAPIDSATFVLIAMGMAYGCYKIYRIWRNKAILKEKEPV